MTIYDCILAVGVGYFVVTFILIAKVKIPWPNEKVKDERLSK
jgi:hypothetical protein